MRSEYSDDDCVNKQVLALWRGTVERALRGKRGQRFLRELAAALDAMPVKELIRYDFVRDGQCCAIGSLCLAKGINTQKYGLPVEDIEEDIEDYLQWVNAKLSNLLDVAKCLVQEVEYENDEGGKYHETPAERWARMRRWVAKHIRENK